MVKNDDAMICEKGSEYVIAISPDSRIYDTKLTEEQMSGILTWCCCVLYDNYCRESIERIKKETAVVRKEIEERYGFRKE